LQLYACEAYLQKFQERAFPSHVSGTSLIPHQEKVRKRGRARDEKKGEEKREKGEKEQKEKGQI